MLKLNIDTTNIFTTDSYRSFIQVRQQPHLGVQINALTEVQVLHVYTFKP